MVDRLVCMRLLWGLSSETAMDDGLIELICIFSKKVNLGIMCWTEAGVQGIFNRLLSR